MLVLLLVTCLQFQHLVLKHLPVTDDATNDAINLVGGSIAADGTITRPSYSIGRFKRIEDSSDTDVTDGYSSNTTGSDRPVTLTFVFDIPDGS